MKKLILAFALFCAHNYGVAQVKEFNYLDNGQVIGVYNLQNEAAALSYIDYRTVDEKDIYVLSYLNNEQDQVQLTTMHDSRLIEVAEGKDATYLVFEQVQSGSVEIIGVTPDHKLKNVVYQTEVASENIVFQGNTRLVATNQTGNVFVFRTFSLSEKNARGGLDLKERGTQILVFNADLQMKGEHRVQGVGGIAATFPIEEGIVVAYETKDVKQKTYNLDLLIFDNALNEKGKHALAVADEGTFFPSEIIAYNGDLVLAGYTIKKSIFEAQKTEGLFIRKIGMDGSLKNNAGFTWEQLKELLKNKSKGDFIFNGKKTVLVEQIIPTESGFKVLCETYSSNSGVTVAEVIMGESGDKRNVVSVFDFVVFDTDSEGNLTAVNILEKPAMNIEVKASRSLKGIALENQLKKHRAMPFKKIDGNTISFVNYENHEGIYSTMDLTTGAITQGQAIKINAGEQKKGFEEKLVKAAKELEYGIEQIDYIFNPYGKSAFSYFIMEDGSVVVYLYSPETYSVFYEVLK